MRGIMLACAWRTAGAAARPGLAFEPRTAAQRPGRGSRFSGLDSHTQKMIFVCPGFGTGSPSGKAYGSSILAFFAGTAGAGANRPGSQPLNSDAALAD